MPATSLAISASPFGKPQFFTQVEIALRLDWVAKYLVRIQHRLPKPRTGV